MGALVSKSRKSSVELLHGLYATCKVGAHIHSCDTIAFLCFCLMNPLISE
jgi:hypothetical protein